MKFLLAFLLLLSYNFTTAQIDTSRVSKENIYIITLKDGTVIKGKIISQNNTEWEIETENLGIVKIPFQNIAKFEPSEDNKYGDYRKNIFAYRYLFLPSAIPMKKKSFDLQSIIYFNTFSYGITNNWSIAGGFFPFSSTEFFPYWVSTKLSGKVGKKLYLGGQLTNLGITGRLTENLSLLYPSFLVTYGHTNSNFTVGLGQAFVSSNDEQARSGPIWSLSFTQRIAPKTMFTSQNSVFLSQNNDDQFALFSLGFRFLGKNHAFNVSMMGGYPSIDQAVQFFPFGSYQLRIRGRENNK